MNWKAIKSLVELRGADDGVNTKNKGLWVIESYPVGDVNMYQITNQLFGLNPIKHVVNQTCKLKKKSRDVQSQQDLSSWHIE